MKKITEEELKKILENHSHWLKGDCDGWEDMKANLSGVDLRDAYLSGSDLSWSELRGADLRDAYLRGAYLRGADLSGADRRMACLRGVVLSYADLRGADLRDADIRGAYLRGANLSGAKNVPFIPIECPDTGSFTAYKKASGKIVKLMVPEEARRSSATGRKCRCDKALVVEIQNVDGTKADVDSVCSNYDKGFVYTVGKMVSVPDFCEDRFKECAAGIHFFINRQEAVKYGE